MSDEEVPSFRYHPNPFDTGSFKREQMLCGSCGLERSVEYVGPKYGRHRTEPRVCPWCIASGEAATKLDLMFADSAPLAGLDAALVDRVVARTPGYVSWQGDQWMTHCDDACAYLGPVGTAELKSLPAQATQAAREALADWGRSEAERDELFSYLHRDGDLTAHLFRCLHCEAFVVGVESS